MNEKLSIVVGAALSVLPLWAVANNTDDSKQWTKAQTKSHAVAYNQKFNKRSEKFSEQKKEKEKDLHTHTIKASSKFRNSSVGRFK